MDYAISIVVPAYNYAHLLPRAIDSVACQHAGDIELIVVDDGSTDTTPEVLKEYVRRYPWIRSVRQENAGAASARNHGIRLASGRFVLLLDADDELLPGALDALKAAQQAHPDAGIIIGGSISVLPGGEERTRVASRIPQVSRPALVKHYLLEKKISISHSRSMFLRELLAARPYPENLRSREDLPVFAYLLASAEVVSIDRPLARIHKHADSLRHRSDDEERIAMAVVDEVFRTLPPACLHLSARYRAQQYLSLFRAASERGERKLAFRRFRMAARLSARQALQWRYLRKIFCLLLSKR